jgi:hypothetical protein
MYKILVSVGRHSLYGKVNNKRHAWQLVLGSRQVTRAIFNLHCQEIFFRYFCRKKQYRKGILERAIFLIKVSYQTREFVWFSTLIFPFYKLLFMNRLKFSFLLQIFVCIYKTRQECGFLSNSLVERTVNNIKQKTRVFC